MRHEAFPAHVQTRGQMCYGQKLVIFNGIFTGICIYIYINIHIYII